MKNEKLFNSGENRETQNEARDRALGKAAVDGNYLSADEKLLNEETKRIEEEQAQNDEQMKAILEQFKIARQERARLQAEKQQKEEEARKIEEQRRAKSIAMKKGLIGMTGWYNKHPEELGEILHPDLKPQLEQLQKEHAENGKSFYNAIKDSLRLENIDAEMAALQNERSKIVNEVQMMPEGESDEAAEEFDNAMPIDTPEMYEEQEKVVEQKDDIKQNDETIAAQPASETAENIEEKNEIVESGNNEIAETAENVVAEAAENAVESVASENENGQNVEWKKVAVDRVMDTIGDELAQRVADNIKEQMGINVIVGEGIDDSEDSKKRKKFSRIKEKWNNAKGGFKRMMVSAAAVAMMILTLTSCASNIANNTKASDNSPQDEITEEAPNIDLAMTAEAKENVNANVVNYYTVDHEGKKQDLSLDLDLVDRDRAETAENPFDKEVVGKGETLTADKKENPGSFGPVLSAEELSGDIDGLEKNNLGDLVKRMAEQPELLAYYGSQIGAFDDVEIPGIELSTIKDGMSTEGATVDGETIRNMNSHQRQMLLDAVSNKIKGMAEGGEVRAVVLPGGTSYITAHIDKTDDGKEVFAAGESHKDSDYAVMKLINKDGADVYDSGETKLNILQMHGSVDKEAALGSDAANEAMAKYTVLGLRNKCGGQFVIVEKGTTVTVDGQSVNAEDSGTPTTPENPDNPGDKTGSESTGEESTGEESTGEESTGEEPTGDEPTGVEPTGVEPTGTEIVGKTNTNPWARNNPSILPVTKSFEQISEENDGARIVQRGQEQKPNIDTSGVNTKPEDQQDWAEKPTEPVRDTGTGGTVDQSADSDAAAAEMLRQTEEALKNA